MARTSKTKIGDSGESNDRMMRAASSGASAVAQAHGELMAQQRHGQQQTLQTAQVANEIVGRGIDRNQQQEQFDARMAQDASQFSQQMDMQRDRTDLEAVKAGFERGGEDGGKQGPQGDRQQKLEEEMRRGEGQPKIGPLDAESQQRLNEQVSKPLEMDSGGRWRPTEERKQQQRREDFQADTERIRAMAYRDQVGVAAQKALASGDKKAYEENVDRLVATPNDMQKRYDRLMKGDVNTNDWGELSKMAQGGPDSDPTLMADLKSQQFTPRVAAFVRAQVQKDALSSIVLSKGSTNKLEVDWTAPKMREFQDQVSNLNAFMKGNPALSQLAFIRSTEDKMRFLNVMAASQVLLGMTRAPSPSGGMMPATAGDAGGGAPQGGQQPMGPEHSMQNPLAGQATDAVRQARAGGATPQQALQAGQRVHPTGAEPPKRPEYHQIRGAGL